MFFEKPIIVAFLAIIKTSQIFQNFYGLLLIKEIIKVKLKIVQFRVVKQGKTKFDLLVKYDGDLQFLLVEVVIVHVGQIF